MRYLFLDFDGVVMTASSYLQPAEFVGHPGFGGGDMAATCMDPMLVGRVSRLCLEVGAEVVLSTSWRSTNNGGLVAALRHRGLDPRVNVAGKTPRLYGPKLSSPPRPRGGEILAWLGEHAPGWAESDIVVLDDDADIRPLDARWVRTTWEHGFTEECLGEALKLFK